MIPYGTYTHYCGLSAGRANRYNVPVVGLAAQLADIPSSYSAILGFYHIGYFPLAVQDRRLS